MVAPPSLIERELLPARPIILIPHSESCLFIIRTAPSVVPRSCPLSTCRPSRFDGRRLSWHLLSPIRAGFPLSLSISLVRDLGRLGTCLASRFSLVPSGAFRVWDQCLG